MFFFYLLGKANYDHFLTRKTMYFYNLSRTNGTSTVGFDI